MESYLPSILKQLEYCKSVGDKTIEQLSFEELQKELVDNSNSASIIIKHIAGNMLSRWTNFLTEDGEKSWRHRDREFIDTFKTKEELLAYWNKGWECLFDGLRSLKTSHLEQIVYIRNQGHTVLEAINRQLSHYSYHIGQIVFLAKLLKGSEWKTLSIPKGKSAAFNKEKFGKEKGRRHFTEDL